MNIIALLESISLDKSRIGSFATTDYTEIKKQLIVLKEVNPEIEDSQITQLLKALKSNPEELKVILNNRGLFNFFAKTDYPRTNFSYQADTVDAEKVKAFVQSFLADELTSFFIQNLEANNFEQIGLMAEAQQYFPDVLNFSLRQHALDKLDEAIAALKPPYGNFSKILYVKDAHFFTFLNNIKDTAIETRMEAFFHTMKDFYNQNHGSELASKAFAAMHKYNPTDSTFAEKIKNYRETSAHHVGGYVKKKKNLTWLYVLVGVFILARIIIFINVSKFNRNNDYDHYDDTVTYDESDSGSAAADLDPYYTGMKFKIDSFHKFLTNFKDSEIKKLTRESALKTGENPFETFYENTPTPDSNNFITITNKTGYDMVILENAVMYDSIKIPRSAHFIKAGDRLEINFNSGYTDTVFNMYLGKKWATFQTDKNLFIRDGSIVEYRFSELIPDSKDILKTDYNFINDAVISYSHGGLNIDSPGARINPLNHQLNK